MRWCVHTPIILIDVYPVSLAFGVEGHLHCADRWKMIPRRAHYNASIVSVSRMAAAAFRAGRMRNFHRFQRRRKSTSRELIALRQFTAAGLPVRAVRRTFGIRTQESGRPSSAGRERHRGGGNLPSCGYSFRDRRATFAMAF